MTRLLADARAIAATRSGRWALTIIAAGIVVALSASCLIPYIPDRRAIVAAGMPRPGCDVPHRPDRPRVEGSARTGARLDLPFHGTRPITLPARQVNPRLSSLALPGRATAGGAA